MLDYIQTLRSMIGHTRIIVPGVRALLFNDAGEILLEQQRWFDSWALPHGCVDLGESALGALKREVKEETGLDVIRAEPFGMYTDPIYSVIYPNGDEVQTFTIAFLVTEWAGKLLAEAEEVSALRFFPLDGLPASLYPIHIDTIEDFRRHEHGFITK
jgi:8-oxo-dGTP pyrophosphatase MutT (NUDIX family)